MTEDKPQDTTPQQPAEPTPAEAEKPQGKPTIQYDDFVKIELVVGKVISADAHPNADKLLVLKVDMGGGQERQILAGIRQWSDPADLVGKNIIVVANLAPRKMRGIESQGMLLAASNKDGDEYRDVVILTTDRDVRPGSPVS